MLDQNNYVISKLHTWGLQQREEHVAFNWIQLTYLWLGRWSFQQNSVYNVQIINEKAQKACYLLPAASDGCFRDKKRSTHFQWKRCVDRQYIDFYIQANTELIKLNDIWFRAYRHFNETCLPRKNELNGPSMIDVPNVHFVNYCRRSKVMPVVNYTVHIKEFRYVFREDEYNHID